MRAIGFPVALIAFCGSVSPDVSPFASLLLCAFGENGLFWSTAPCRCCNNGSFNLYSLGLGRMIVLFHDKSIWFTNCMPYQLAEYE